MRMLTNPSRMSIRYILYSAIILAICHTSTVSVLQLSGYFLPGKDERRCAAGLHLKRGLR